MDLRVDDKDRACNDRDRKNIDRRVKKGALIFIDPPQCARLEENLRAIRLTCLSHLFNVRLHKCFPLGFGVTFLVLKIAVKKANVGRPVKSTINSIFLGDRTSKPTR